MPTHHQIMTAAFALCPHICALKGCDKTRCQPCPSTVAAAKAALEAVENTRELFELAPTETDDWPNDYVEQFWKRYPRHIAKAAAAKKLEIIRRSKRVRFSVLLAGVERYARSVKNVEMGLICHPTTWLNGGRWEDDERSLEHVNGKSGFAEITRRFAGIE